MKSSAASNPAFRSLLAIAVLAGSTLSTAAARAQATPPATPTPTPTTPAPAKAESPAAPATTVSKLDLPFDNLGTNQSDPSAAVVYLIKVRGEVGKDFSTTPLKKALEDAKRVQPDIIVLDIDSALKPAAGQDPEDDEGGNGLPAGAFDSVDAVTEISDALINDIRDGSAWVKKPRVVAWVKRALGPAAFLPFVCKDIYYTPEAKHGEIGYLDLVFEGMGDDVVREKQRSLRLGRAEGIAVKGGHDFRIIRAMARMDYVLSYTMVGGKPEFHEDMSGDTVLTDDGNLDLGRRDTVEARLRNAGDDVLTLTTPVAKRIGFIQGEAATLDDLAFELGIQRAYKVYGRRADKVLADWRKQVDGVLPQFRKLQRDQGEWRLTGNTAAERNQSRAKLKRSFQQMIDLLLRNKEIAAAGGFRDPDAIVDQWRQRIAQIDQQIRLDRDDR